MDEMQDFMCCRCGVCCRQPGYVYLTAEDAPGMPGVAEAVPARGFKPRAGGRAKRGPLTPAETEECAKFLKTDVFEFVNTNCELLNRRRLVLKKRENETRTFFMGNRCRIYPARPRQCRDFPVKWKTENSLEYCLGLNAGRRAVADEKS